MRNATARIMRFISRKRANTIRTKKLIVSGRRHRCQRYITRKKQSIIFITLNKSKEKSETSFAL
jgi:hypothetical protein